MTHRYVTTDQDWGWSEFAAHSMLYGENMSEGMHFFSISEFF